MFLGQTKGSAPHMPHLDFTTIVLSYAIDLFELLCSHVLSNSANIICWCKNMSCGTHYVMNEPRPSAQISYCKRQTRKPRNEATIQPSGCTYTLNAKSSHFVNFPHCQLPTLSTSHFVNFPLCQLPTLSTSHIVNFPLCQLPIWSMLSIPIWSMLTKWE